MANVHLVEDVGNSPGKVYAIFAHEEDADKFAELIEDEDTRVEVVERTLFYGQPPVRGFNP